MSFNSGMGNETDLRATDGTVSGTQRLGEALPADEPYTQTTMIVHGDRIYFSGYDDINGISLWHSDGTKRGTGMAIDFEPGFHRFAIQEPAVHNGLIFVVANTTAAGEEIWSFDGKRATQVTELMPGTFSANPRRLRSVYFTAYVNGQGRELNVLDR